MGNIYCPKLDMAYFLIAQGQFSTALAVLEQMEILVQNYQDQVNYLLGVTYMQLGEREQQVLTSPLLSIMFPEWLQEYWKDSTHFFPPTSNVALVGGQQVTKSLLLSIIFVNRLREYWEVSTHSDIEDLFNMQTIYSFKLDVASFLIAHGQFSTALEANGKPRRRPAASGQSITWKNIYMQLGDRARAVKVAKNLPTIPPHDSEEDIPGILNVICNFVLPNVTFVDN